MVASWLYYSGVIQKNYAYVLIQQNMSISEKAQNIQSTILTIWFFPNHIKCHLSSQQKTAFFIRAFIDHPVWIRTPDQVISGGVGSDWVKYHNNE